MVHNSHSAIVSLHKDGNACSQRLNSPGMVVQMSGNVAGVVVMMTTLNRLVLLLSSI